MSREIKFKAWDNLNKNMHEVHRINFTGRITVDSKLFENDTRFLTLENAILLQYTGLKDKNGVDIYEDSDVLKITNTKRFTGGKDYTCYSKVKIIDGHVYCWPHPIVDGKPIRFGAKMLLSGMAKRIEMRGVATNDVEVVGNIYDNPELMERDLN